MQLDRTEIVIRARSVLELLDLSLQVLKRHVGAIAITSAILGVPLLLLDSLAVSWMLSEDALLAAERLEFPLSAMRWRHSTHLILLFAMQFPLISLPTSVYLGNRIFYEPMPLTKLLRRLRPIAFRCLLVLGVMRLGLVGLLMELLVDRATAFDFGVEFWLVFVVGATSVLFRASWPFAPEILGLELCPLLAGRGELKYADRSRGLHRFLFSENLARFAGAAFFSVLLFSTLVGAQMFLIGASTGLWQWNYWFDYVGLPLTMWVVGLFMAVFRFLSYLDSRIRLEGWEVELRLKAEAVRLSNSSKIATESKTKLTSILHTDPALYLISPDAMPQEQVS